MASYAIDVNTCTLRPATTADIESMVAIDHTNPGPWSIDRFSVILGADADRRERVSVAQLDALVEGFLVYSRVLDEVTVHNIAVRTRQQGRGIGSLLVSGLLEQMTGAGASRCLLEVRQVRELPRSGGYRIGCKLKMWPDRRHIRRWQQAVQHHLTTIQRERSGQQRRSA